MIHVYTVNFFFQLQVFNLVDLTHDLYEKCVRL